jgi:hypothetical protein
MLPGPPAAGAYTLLCKFMVSLSSDPATAAVINVLCDIMSRAVVDDENLISSLGALAAIIATEVASNLVVSGIPTPLQTTAFNVSERRV